MGSKTYFTLKKANEVLSLYGIRIIKKLEWEATKIYIPYDRKTNIKRVEYVLENLERLK